MVVHVVQSVTHGFLPWCSPAGAFLISCAASAPALTFSQNAECADWRSDPNKKDRCHRGQPACHYNTIVGALAWLGSTLAKSPARCLQHLSGAFSYVDWKIHQSLPKSQLQPCPCAHIPDMPSKSLIRLFRKPGGDIRTHVSFSNWPLLK